MKLIKLNGKVINVGEWDYCLTENGEVTNPLPVGAVECDEDYSPIVRIDADTVLSRLTTAERESLFTARRTIWQVDYFLTRAASTGIVSTADPDLAAAQQLFAAYGIIAADRWADILAP